MAAISNLFPQRLTDSPSTEIRAISRLETSFIVIYLEGPSCTSLIGTSIK